MGTDFSGDQGDNMRVRTSLFIYLALSCDRMNDQNYNLMHFISRLYARICPDNSKKSHFLTLNEDLLLY